MADFRILNTELMAHPANWIIIPLMMVLGSLLIKFLHITANPTAQ